MSRTTRCASAGELLRIDGIGDIDMQGARDYAMRVWLDPGRMAANGIIAEDVVAAIQAQNAEIAGGQIAEPPVADQAFQPNLTFRGRLGDPAEFQTIVIHAGADGRLLRLHDIGRVELGAASYTTGSTLQGRPAVALAVTQRPGSNALATAGRSAPGSPPSPATSPPASPPRSPTT